MVILRWLGAAALAGSVGCSASTGNAPDGSAVGADGGPQADGAPGPDALGSDAGAGDAECVTGSVSFVLETVPGATTTYCLGAAGTCSTQWLEIRTEAGTSYTTEMPCMAQCGPCQPVACSNLCAAPGRLGDAGAQTSWDGTYFAFGTCGAGLGCASQACAPAGSYVARACAFAAAADAATVGACPAVGPQTCVDVPFAWPPPSGSAPIHLVLGATSGDAGDAGSCCPAGWGLSTCTFADGGTGQQCHNPALGCASSTTCGQGCDAIVTGRCDGG